MWMFSLQNTSDYITPDVAYNGSVQIDGTQYNYLQYSRPVNMDGYWSVRTHLSYETARELHPFELQRHGRRGLHPDSPGASTAAAT